jgi:hypothetical protein
MLPDGNYLLTIPAIAIADLAGNSLAADMILNFFVLGGDANRDRTVDINDLAILTMNWQSNAAVFAQGDFNYDGTIDALDLGILSANWQKTLAPPAAPASPTSLNKRTPKRSASTLISVVP